ncbi:MAG: DUF3179 domain-containing protein [Chloroflexi bacterium]|nr:DUF3179 domain-containing protein [Chloroflexota bacterium]
MRLCPPLPFLLLAAVVACEPGFPTLLPSSPLSSTVTTTPVVALPSPVSTASSAPDEDLSYSQRTPFVALDNPRFINASQAGSLASDDLVLGLEWEGQTRAYPLSMMTYHHIANDAIGGKPFLATY